MPHVPELHSNPYINAAGIGFNIYDMISNTGSGSVLNENNIQKLITYPGPLRSFFPAHFCTNYQATPNQNTEVVNANATFNLSYIIPYIHQRRLDLWGFSTPIIITITGITFGQREAYPTNDRVIYNQAISVNYGDDGTQVSHYNKIRDICASAANAVGPGNCVQIGNELFNPYIAYENQYSGHFYRPAYTAVQAGAMISACSDAIKSANPNVKILLPGMYFQANDEFVPIVQNLQSRRGPLPSQYACFDIVPFHHYNASGGVGVSPAAGGVDAMSNGYLNAAVTYGNKPVWRTEGDGYDYVNIGTANYATEANGALWSRQGMENMALKNIPYCRFQLFDTGSSGQYETCGQVGRQAYTMMASYIQDYYTNQVQPGIISGSRFYVKKRGYSGILC